MWGGVIIFYYFQVDETQAAGVRGDTGFFFLMVAKYKIEMYKSLFH